MRSLWMLGAGLVLVLSGCRTDGNRGEAVDRDRGAAPPGAGQRTDRGGATSADEAGVTRILAATRTITQAEVDAGKLAEQRASSPEVKDYATRAVAEYQASLDALSDLVKAKKIDLDQPGVQNDPVLKAHKDSAKENLDRLRSLSGTAFDAAYMTGQRPTQTLLAQLGAEGQQVSKDPDIGNVLRAVAQQARDRTSKALSILPKACGGARPGWGGAG